MFDMILGIKHSLDPFSGGGSDPDGSPSIICCIKVWLNIVYFFYVHPDFHTTKLFIPPPRPGVVLRPRLIEQMNNGLAMGRKLTIISASAGFGKTTLVSEWVAGCERSTRSPRLVVIG